jgi:hypothetical protein
MPGVSSNLPSSSRQNARAPSLETVSPCPRRQSTAAPMTILRDQAAPFSRLSCHHPRPARSCHISRTNRAVSGSAPARGSPGRDAKPRCAGLTLFGLGALTHLERRLDAHGLNGGQHAVHHRAITFRLPRSYTGLTRGRLERLDKCSVALGHRGRCRGPASFSHNARSAAIPITRARFAEAEPHYLLYRHLKRFIAYYHRSRTHMVLGKDSPEPRPIQPPTSGRIIAIPVMGGLHHPKNGG